LVDETGGRCKRVRSANGKGAVLLYLWNQKTNRNTVRYGLKFDGECGPLKVDIHCHWMRLTIIFVLGQLTDNLYFIFDRHSTTCRILTDDRRRLERT
jgi:hypothetical protein